MTLQSDERNAIIHYRIERALSSLQEAKDTASMGHWNLAVQRLYYATYYIQSALLIRDGLSAGTHVGLKSLVGLNYVKTGILTAEEGALLGRLFQMRQTGDYSDNFDWTEKDVKPLIIPTETLIIKIQNLIENKP